MAMSQIEYKELLLRFGDDLQQINDDLYQATKPKTPPKKRESVMKSARQKLQDYDGLLAQLQGTQRSQAEGDFGDLMSEMRGYLSQLEKGR